MRQWGKEAEGKGHGGGSGTGHGALVARQWAIGVAGGHSSPGCPSSCDALGRPSPASAAHERIRQLVDQNRQPMRRTGISISNPPAGAGNGRLLLHLGPGLRQAIDPDDIYFVEAEGDDTRVRTRAARALRDVRPIGRSSLSS